MKRNSQDSSPFPHGLFHRSKRYPWNHQSSESETDLPPVNPVYASPKYFDRDSQDSSPLSDDLSRRSEPYPWNHQSSESDMDFPPMNEVYASPKFLERNSPDALLHIDALLRDGSLRCFDIPVHNAILIGRDAHCDLCIDDPLVSRRHLEIRANCGDVQIRDMQSLNGTRLNGEALRAPVALNSGDEVTIGNTRLVIRF